MEFFIVIFCILIILGFWALVAAKFDQIAEEKGHPGYFWWVFFLGMIGILMVVALPDRGSSGSEYNDNGLLNKLKLVWGKSDSKTESSKTSSTWICKQCKSVNTSEHMFCRGCGKHKLNTETTQNSLQSWTCKKCGKSNPQYTGTCSCGHSKYDN